MRTTAPRPQNRVRMRPTTTIFRAAPFMLMLQSFFLIRLLLRGSDFRSVRFWLGNDWYNQVVLTTLARTVCVAIAAVPCVILGLVRRARHRGAMIGILACITVAGFCSFGVLFFVSALSYG